MINNIVLKVENLSKMYQLGEVGTGTLSHDLNRWWHKVRGKEDPYSKVGQVNQRDKQADSDYVYVLKDIDFEVSQGEVLGIIGKNGAGKSTLLKILSKVTGPTSGQIKMKGRVASLLEVGTGMHPELTARENIFLNGAILGMTKTEIKNKFDEIVEFAGIAMYIDTPVKRFSSGMRVRLGFAVAAFLEPEILIVDEVLAVGDAEFQKKAIGKMQEVSQGQGRTVLFVSHNMASVQNLCSKLLVLDQGGIAYQGEVDEGIQFYLSQGGSETSKNFQNKLVYKRDIGLKFFNLSITNSIGNEVETFCSGDDVNINLSFNSKQDLKGIKVRFELLAADGSIISILNSNHVVGLMNVKSGKGVITCSLNKIPLVKGSYSLNFICRLNKELIVSLDNTAKLNILDGDFYKTGKLPVVKKGVLFDQNFVVSQ